MSPKVLAEALQTLTQSRHPDLLVGFDKSDDAGVFRISARQALVQTVDFFPPIVDDPFSFGQIAAANALSDIYAMWGKPLTALNIVGFPVGDMPLSVLTEILRGGGLKIEEAGAVVLGGHSIKDKELKYGVSVTGVIDPDRIVTNSGAQVGDYLYLTKPLGTGLITTGIKRNKVSEELTAIVIESMSMLNRTAAELMLKHDVHAATDVTGYGLLGHAYEMAAGSNATILIDSEALPLLPDVVNLVQQGMITGGAKDNRDYVSRHTHIAEHLDPSVVEILFDPQTSGGLLIAVPQNQAAMFESALREHGLWCRPIGRVEKRGAHSLIVE